MSYGAKIKEFVESNKKQRMDFVELWAEYVKTHDDKDWSSQQAKIINSMLKTNISKEHYLKMKSNN